MASDPGVEFCSVGRTHLASCVDTPSESGRATVALWRGSEPSDRGLPALVVDLGGPWLPVGAIGSAFEDSSIAALLGVRYSVLVGVVPPSPNGIGRSCLSLLDHHVRWVLDGTAAASAVRSDDVITACGVDELDQDAGYFETLRTALDDLGVESFDVLGFSYAGVRWTSTEAAAFMDDWGEPHSFVVASGLAPRDLARTIAWQATAAESLWTAALLPSCDEDASRSCDPVELFEADPELAAAGLATLTDPGATFGWARTVLAEHSIAALADELRIASHSYLHLNAAGYPRESLLVYLDGVCRSAGDLEGLDGLALQSGFSRVGARLHTICLGWPSSPVPPAAPRSLCSVRPPADLVVPPSESDRVMEGAVVHAQVSFAVDVLENGCPMTGAGVGVADAITGLQDSVAYEISEPELGERLQDWARAAGLPVAYPVVPGYGGSLGGAVLGEVWFSWPDASVFLTVDGVQDSAVSDAVGYCLVASGGFPGAATELRDASYVIGVGAPAEQLLCAAGAPIRETVLSGGKVITEWWLCRSEPCPVLPPAVLHLVDGVPVLAGSEPA